jgi:pimeloyl-ACP methyl ester carboxylesterase
MNVVDRGVGVPIVLVPGVQGRWQWHRPTIDVLAERFRVISFSFADEPDSGADRLDGSCIEAYTRQLGQALDQAGLEQAVICGVSYGGLVAATFSARHPQRVSALILVSALPPGWTPDARVRAYLNAPRLMLPVFLLNSLGLIAEIRRARGGIVGTLGFGASQVWSAVTHLSSPRRMARRASQLMAPQATPPPGAITAPTLVLVGEPALDRVVPVRSTLEYLRLIPQATVLTLSDTGHLGSVTKPREFATIVSGFLTQHVSSTDSEKSLGRHHP